MYNQLYDKLQVVEKEVHLLSAEDRLLAIRSPLLSWYEQYARMLPWRENPTPYAVWISEIMLQQTRVEAVKPYFYRFMAALPTISDLACVEEEQLLKLWEGLGYYNRAKNLKKTAQIVVSEYQGRLPANYELLLKLPGIGSYTAGAIASIAYGIAVPAVDGNVLRVLSRVLASFEDILKQKVKKQFENRLQPVVLPARPGDFNQALIEIGAIVCVPNGQPKCGECPLSTLCLGRKQGLLDVLPVKTKKKERKIEQKTVFLIEYQQKIGLNKRMDKGLLASLYEFPNIEGHLPEEAVKEVLGVAPEHILALKPLPEARHIFSHVEWHMIGYHIILDKKDINVGFFATRRELKEKYALPNAFQTYMLELN